MADTLTLLARSEVWAELDTVQGYLVLEGHLPGTGRFLREVVDSPDMDRLIRAGQVSVSDQPRLTELFDAGRTLKPITVRYYRVTGN